MFKEGILKNGWVQPAEEGQGLPVVETPPPDSLEHGYKAVAHYEQHGSQIIKVWDIQPWSDQDWQNAREAEAKSVSEDNTPETKPEA